MTSNDEKYILQNTIEDIESILRQDNITNFDDLSYIFVEVYFHLLQNNKKMMWDQKQENVILLMERIRNYAKLLPKP